MAENLTKTCLAVAIATAAIIGITCEGAQLGFTKSEDLPALRLRYSDLEDVLAKASRLSTDPNRQVILSSNFLARFTADYGKELESGEAQRFAEKQRDRILKEFPRERLVVSGHGEDVSLANHSLGGATRLPQAASSVSYRYDFYDGSVPIAGISLLFNDSFRRVEVSGSSSEHVDAVMSTLRADLLKFSTTLGGSRFRMWTGMVFMLVAVIMFNISIALLPKRPLFGSVLLICSVCAVGALMFLPFDRWLPGIAIYRDDPSFLVRYGPEIGFAGLLLGVSGIAISLYQSATEKRETSSSKKRITKRKKTQSEPSVESK